MKIKRYLKRQSPLILTCIGAVGTIATAVTAVRATPKAMNLCYEVWDASEEGRDPTTIDYVRVAWKEYIPSILIGAGTIAAIFGANTMNRRQQAAITSAYIFLERSYKSYRDKIIEIYGKEADREAKAAVAKDTYEPVEPPADSEVLLFYEEHYGQYFQRRMTEVQDAEYRLNRKFATDGEASLNDFFEFLGLDEREIGDSLGWTQESICDFYNPAWIDFEHQLVTMDDGMECYIIHILVTPTYQYDDPPF